MSEADEMTVVTDAAQDRTLNPRDVDAELVAICDDAANDLLTKLKEGGPLKSGEVWGCCISIATEGGLSVMSYPTADAYRALLKEIGTTTADAVMLNFSPTVGKA